MSKPKTNIIQFKRQNKRSVVMIVATSLDGIIGHNNDIPWSCKEDMTFFRKATTGNVVIMGRNTYESIGKPLPNRVNIVVSKTLKDDKNIIDDSLIVVDNLDDALLKAQDVSLNTFSRNTESEHVYIMGGLQLYKASNQYVDELLHSVINTKVGYGIGGDLFENNILMEKNVMQVLYYNTIFKSKDVTSLYEIIHYYNETQTNRFKFKET